MIGYLLGIILAIEAALLLLPAAVAAGNNESVLPYLITIGALLVVSIPAIIFKPENKQIYIKEGFVTVAIGWILLSLFGALPFLFSGAIPNYIDALFETISGLTTTGASILTEIESLPRGILFWRSFTHWIGGMGILVFMLAILPSSGSSAIYLMKAEVPGPTKGKLVPKMRKTALILYGIYIFLTFLEMLILCICGLPLYDAAVNAFATAGTGGFSVLNDSIAGYANPAVEWVIAIFMFVFGVNFNLYFFILIGNLRDVFKNEELRVYALICLASSTLIAINTASLFEGRIGDCIRTAFFQVTSIMSTTGFATADFNAWPAFSKAIILILLLFGASAGSTAGGLKISRVLILFKSIAREIRHILHPRSVNVVRLDGKVVPDETVRAANSYLIIYFAIILASFVAISLDGGTTETNITAVLTCVNNVGPGFGDIGPAGNFAAFSCFSKLILSGDMLIGRLEIIPLLVLFSPSTWKRR